MLLAPLQRSAVHIHGDCGGNLLLFQQRNRHIAVICSHIDQAAARVTNSATAESLFDNCMSFLLTENLVQIIFKFSGTTRMAELSKRFRLNLTDTLSCNVELFTNLFEGSRTAVIESETETQNLLLTVSQRA